MLIVEFMWYEYSVYCIRVLNFLFIWKNFIVKNFIIKIEVIKVKSSIGYWKYLKKVDIDINGEVVVRKERERGY